MPLNIDFVQILLHMFNFVLLFGILYFLLYSPIKKFMDTRAQEYKDTEARIENDLKNASSLKQEYEEKLENVNSEIEQLRQESDKAAVQNAEKILSNAKAEADAIIKKAHKEAALELESVTQKARKDIASAANEMVEKLVNTSVSSSYDSFIESANRSGEDA